MWKVISTGQIRTWELTSDWSYVTNTTLYAPTSAEGLVLSNQFMVDSSGNPLNILPYIPPTTVGPSPTPSPTVQVLDPNGLVKLTRNISDDKVSIDVNGSLTTVKLSNVQITSNQFADRQILAAERINDENRILWKETSTGNIRTWLLDNNWNFVNNNNPLVSPTSAEGLLLQNQFGLNINAPIGNLVDPITGFTTKEMLPACACANCTASTTALDTRTVPVYDNFKSNEKTFSLQLSSTNQPIVNNSLTSIILSSEKSSLPQNPQPLI